MLAGSHTHLQARERHELLHELIHLSALSPVLDVTIAVMVVDSGGPPPLVCSVQVQDGVFTFLYAGQCC